MTMSNSDSRKRDEEPRAAHNAVSGQTTAQRIEAVLDHWTSCWCATMPDGIQDRRRDCPQHGSDDCRHMAEGIVLDLRSLAATLASTLDDQLNEARREALLSAADDTEADSALYGAGLAHPHVWLRARANANVLASTLDEGAEVVASEAAGNTDVARHLPGGKAGGGCYMAGPGNKPNRPLVCSPDCPVTYPLATELGAEHDLADLLVRLNWRGKRADDVARAILAAGYRPPLDEGLAGKVRELADEWAPPPPERQVKFGDEMPWHKGYYTARHECSTALAALLAGEADR